MHFADLVDAARIVQNTLGGGSLTGVNVDLWYALLAPTETPHEIVARYNKVVNEILATPKVRDLLAQQGLTTRGGSAEDLAQLIARDQVRWTKVIKEAGITAE